MNIERSQSWIESEVQRWQEDYKEGDAIDWKTKHINDLIEALATENSHLRRIEKKDGG